MSLLLMPSVSGCTAGLGATSASYPLAREAADMLLWTTRGHDLGLLARAYCVAGSPQERMWMRDTYSNVAVPAKVVILCPKD